MEPVSKFVEVDFAILVGIDAHHDVIDFFPAVSERRDTLVYDKINGIHTENIELARPANAEQCA